MFRTLWALGVEVPPPFFIHFFPLALLGGVPFGAGMAVFFFGCMDYRIFWFSPQLVVPCLV
jgi:hypothetical protein